MKVNFNFNERRKSVMTNMGGIKTDIEHVRFYMLIP